MSTPQRRRADSSNPSRPLRGSIGAPQIDPANTLMSATRVKLFGNSACDLPARMSASARRTARGTIQSRIDIRSSAPTPVAERCGRRRRGGAPAPRWRLGAGRRSIGCENGPRGIRTAAPKRGGPVSWPTSACFKGEGEPAFDLQGRWRPKIRTLPGVGLAIPPFLATVEWLSFCGGGLCWQAWPSRAPGRSSPIRSAWRSLIDPWRSCARPSDNRPRGPTSADTGRA